MTSAPSPADNPVAQASTTGSGINATFDIVWAPHFEYRFVTGIATLTLTVHEDWIVPPVTGDGWALSYILEDYATKTGVTLRAQSGVFECTRRIKVGPLSDATRRGWLAMLDGKALELDNVADNAFEIANGGLFTMGYTQGGVSVNGAYISTSGEVGPEFEYLTNAGAMYFMHDYQMRSPREKLEFGVVPDATQQFDPDEVLFHEQVGSILRNFKFFDVGPFFHIGPTVIRDGVIQNGGTATDDFGVRLSLDGASAEEGDSFGDIDGLILNGMTNNANGGFQSTRTTFTAAVVFEILKNITFIDCAKFIEVEENETWRFINPVWTPVLTDQVHFDFNSTTGSSIEQLMSLDITVQDASAVAIVGAHGYVYEGALNDDLPTENTNQSDSDSVGLYASSVLDRVYTPNSTTDIIVTARGKFAFRVYDYGNLPVTLPFEIDLNGGIETAVTMLVDAAITETVQATALTNPTSNPVVVRHAPGEADTRPMKVFGYDTGIGTVPTVGETITGAGGATGVVVEFIGDETSGTLVLDTVNATAFVENEQITGATFDADVDQATFDEEYTWEVESQSEAATILYDYLAARMAEDPLVAPFDDAIVWGGDESAANQLIFLGTNGYFTPRAVSRRDGQIQTGATRDFSDTFTRGDEGISANANWDDVDNAASELQLISNAIAGDSTAAQTNVGAVATATHTYTDDQYAECIVNVLPTAGDLIGVACRIDTTLEQCYAAIVREGTPDLYEIVLVDFSTAAGTITVLATGASTPSTTDVIRLVCVDQCIVMWVNDVEEARAVDETLTSGQAGLMAEGDTGQVGRVDGFGSGDVVDGVLEGEGVWIHERGAGTFDFFTSDGGTTFTLPSTVSLTVQVNDPDGGAVVGARVRIEQDSDGALIADGETNASGTFSASFTFTGDLDVLTKVRLKGFKPFRTGGTIESSGLTIGVTFLRDTIVDLP
jgi:hypothetical protein